MSKLADAFLAIIPQVDDSKMSSAMSSITGTLGSVAATGAKAFAAVSTAAVAAGTAIVAASTKEWASYEQNTGGMKKLYGDAYQTMISQAQNAYATCGLSANDYMEQASSFSAALTSSLGGDVVTAASQAQAAMQAMSDNVNTFGTDITDVQNAYQGFAKQNYTMLDNLKLGYGGTKSEMERLIADANEYAAANGEAADLSIDSFSDIVTAIELVQEKQGIAGTTAKEAATTIEGSVNQMKAAWTNWLTSLGDEDWDVSTTTEQLISSVETVAENVIPRITEIISTLVSELPGLLAGLAPSLASSLQSIFSTAFESLFAALPTQLQVGLAEVMLSLDESGVSQALANVFNGGIEELPANLFALAETLAPWLLEQVGAIATNAVSYLSENAPAILNGAFTMFEGIIQALPQIVAELLPALVSLITNAASTIVANAPQLLSASLTGFGQLVQAVVNVLPQVLSSITQLLGSVVTSIISGAPQVLSAAASLFGNILSGAITAIAELLAWVAGVPQRIVGSLGDVGNLLVNAGKSIINGLWNGLKSAWSGVTDWVSGLADTIQSLKGPIPYDRKVLIPNGIALMESLGTGLKKGFAPVAEYVGSMADELSGSMSLSLLPSIASNDSLYSVAVSSTNSKTDSNMSRLYGKIDRLASAISDSETAIYVDSKKLASSIVRPMNQQLGRLAARGA
jgi:phage-related protein